MWRLQRASIFDMKVAVEFSIRAGLLVAAWVALLVGLSGCATTAPQTKAVLKSPPNVPRAHAIANVPFIKQEDGHCGPTTLAMAMQWAGRDVAANELAAKVMTPGKDGSLQEDMIGASRREGLMAVRIEGYQALLREVAADHPVIIFENLGLSWYRQWHFALVHGYDLDREELTLHSGPNAFESADMRVFERSWKLGDYWGLVVLRPGELSVTADELAHLQAASALEKLGFTAEADLAYKAILARWPKSLAALLGRGNVAYKRQDYIASVGFLKQAVALHPESAAAQHNLRVAETASGGIIQKTESF